MSFLNRVVLKPLGVVVSVVVVGLIVGAPLWMALAYVLWAPDRSHLTRGVQLSEEVCMVVGGVFLTAWWTAVAFDFT